MPQCWVFTCNATQTCAKASWGSVSLPSFCRQRPGEVLPRIIQLASGWWMRWALNWGLFDFKAVLNHCPHLLNDYICMTLHLKCPLHTSLSYILGPNWKWLEFNLLYIFIKFYRKFLIPFSTSGCDLALDVCKSIWKWFDVINEADIDRLSTWLSWNPEKCTHLPRRTWLGIPNRHANRATIQMHGFYFSVVVRSHHVAQADSKLRILPQGPSGGIPSVDYNAQLHSL